MEGVDVRITVSCSFYLDFADISLLDASIWSISIHPRLRDDDYHKHGAP
jgi:hypothetical protein